MIYLLAISTGVFSVAFYPALPSMHLYFVGLSSLSLIWLLVERFKLPIHGFVKSIFRFSLLFGWGSAWGFYCAHSVLSHQLPDGLDRHDFLVSGTVAQILKTDKVRTNFVVIVDSAAELANPKNIVHLEKLLLNEYSSINKKGRLDIQEGDHWQFVARLKRPRGMFNPGGFDYQSWLVQSGYSATGYVRHNAANRKNHNYPISLYNSVLLGVNKIRSGIRRAIIKSETSELGRAILIALTVGDRQNIRPWWESLSRLGIVHLLVISGLHIGLIAGAGFMLGSMVSKTLISLSQVLPLVSTNHFFLRLLPPSCGVILATAYSLLAGFTLPTQRALIAIVVVMLASLVYRRITPWACLMWTLLIIAIMQPLAVLSAGFWLSFTAVATLIGWFYPWASSDKNFRVKRTLTVQLALLGLMSLPLFIFIGRISWLAPMVNILIIPLVSLVTVPLALLGVVGLMINQRIANSIWILADWSIMPIQWLLDIIPSSYGFLSLPVIMHWTILATIFMAGLGALLPIPKAFKIVCVIPLGLALLAPSPDNRLQVTVLDVGQGLAVVVERGDRVLVYDAGPRYSESFDAGAGIIVPYLHSRGRRSVDKVIISHEDNDHSGGAFSLINALSPRDVLVGPGFVADLADSFQKSNKDSLRHSPCAAGEKWFWPSVEPNDSDEDANRVYFEMIWPTHDSPTDGNDSSCVLQITWRDQTILLTGDIEARAERRIIADNLIEAANLSLLVAPHHGSKTSSTAQFVSAVMPKHVIFSSGHRHHFGHPHSDVVARYRAAGSKLWRTAEQGALSFSWNQRGDLRIVAARDEGFPECLSCSVWWR
jgi:competence protein ComEC